MIFCAIESGWRMFAFSKLGRDQFAFWLLCRYQFAVSPSCHYKMGDFGKEVAIPVGSCYPGKGVEVATPAGSCYPSKGVNDGSISRSGEIRNLCLDGGPRRIYRAPKQRHLDD